MRAVTALALAVLGGCASPYESSPPPGVERGEAHRVAGLTLLRPGQPFLGGALEVARYETSAPGGRRRVAVTVVNRTARPLELRWRFRYVGADGWERRSADSASWKRVTLGAGEEWVRDGEAEVADASAVGMDWRYGKD